MRGAFIGVLALLGGCAGRGAWSDIEVVDETAQGREAHTVEAIHAIIDFYERWTAVGEVRVHTIALVDDIELPDRELQNLPQGAEVAVGGMYNVASGLIEVNVSAPTSQTKTVRHELCHAVDRVGGYSRNEGDWLEVDQMPEELARETIFLHGHESREVFASLCEWEPQPVLHQVMDQACGTQLRPDMVRRVHEVAFPEWQANGGVDDELRVNWVQVAAVPGQRFWSAGLAGDRAFAVTARYDQSYMVGTDVHEVDAQDGSLTYVASVPEIRRANPGHTPLPSTGELVLAPSSRGTYYHFVDGILVPVTVPEDIYNTRVVAGNWLALQVSGPITIVHLRNGTTHQLDLPTDAGCTLGLLGDDVVCDGPAGRWRLDDLRWTSLDAQPWHHPLLYAERVLPLADGHLMSWYASSTNRQFWLGLAHRGTDGALRLSQDACTPTTRDERNASHVVSNGRDVMTVWRGNGSDGGQIGMVSF